MIFIKVIKILILNGVCLVSHLSFPMDYLEFLNSINNLIALNRKHKISIEAPLIDKTKAEIILMGKDLGVDFARTWTCYEGKNIACGYCTSCSSRIQGFLDAGMKDPLQYERNDIPWNE